jgi:hypothetical protein
MSHLLRINFPYRKIRTATSHVPKNKNSWPKQQNETVLMEKPDTFNNLWNKRRILKLLQRKKKRDLLFHVFKF